MALLEATNEDWSAYPIKIEPTEMLPIDDLLREITAAQRLQPTLKR